MSLRINKSAHFEFHDESSTVSFVWGVGRSKRNESLVYIKPFFPTVKSAFQAFLDEPDLRMKIAKFASAMNLGSESGRQSELVFMLEVLWRFNMEAKPWPKWIRDAVERGPECVVDGEEPRGEKP